MRGLEQNVGDDEEADEGRAHGLAVRGVDELGLHVGRARLEALDEDLVAAEADRLQLAHRRRHRVLRLEELAQPQDVARVALSDRILFSGILLD